MKSCRQEGIRIAVLSAGEILGEVALLDQLVPRTATVLTLAPTTLMRIERAHVQELKRTDPVIRHLRCSCSNVSATAAATKNIPGPNPEAALDSDAANLTLMLAQDLTHAMANGLLEPAYQPLISLPERNLIGFEALIRWQHPLLGSVMPTKLINLAETGLIHPLGLWVLQRAMNDWPTLRSYCQLLRCSARPSSASIFHRPNWAIRRSSSRSPSFLDEGGIPPHELQIELTESAVIEDLPSAKQVLQKLAATGVAIALDDFGTGYASFDYSTFLPISCLKIDQTFIQEVLVSPRRREIVQTSVNLARSLGLISIAEGIEDESTSDLLVELGCGIARLLYARPLSLQAIPSEMAGRSPHPGARQPRRLGLGRAKYLSQPDFGGFDRRKHCRYQQAFIHRKIGRQQQGIALDIRRDHPGQGKRECPLFSATACRPALITSRLETMVSVRMTIEPHGFPVPSNCSTSGCDCRPHS